MKRSPVLWITAFFFAAGLTFAGFQLLPGESLTVKTAFLLLGTFLISFCVGDFLLGVICKNFPLIHRIQWMVFIAAAIVAILLIGLFRLSFPHKELALPVCSIRITVQAETDEPVNFLSLNNGYRGIPLADFHVEGSWQRSGDALVLTHPDKNPVLHFKGKTGQDVALFFRSESANGTLRIDWGDGAVESVALIASPAGIDPQMIRHDYGYSAAAAEKWNFFINLLSIWSFLTVGMTLYFLVLASLLARRGKNIIAIFLLLTAATIFIRTINVYNFPLGWDEGTYSRAAMRYSEKMLAFEWKDIPAITYNHEHPAFVKLMFAVPAALDGRIYFERFGWAQGNRATLGKEDYTIFTSRLVSALFSLWTVQALALLVHPLAGFFFMIHSYAEAYGAQARLEAIPMLFSFLSVWLFWSALAAFKWKKKLPIKKLLLSAVFLGLTAASKIIYCVVAFAIAAAALEALIAVKTNRWNLIRALVAMAAVSLVSFFLFNPSLWYDPPARLVLMLGFHEQYQLNVRDIYPWWQPVAWVTRSIVHQSAIYFMKNPLARAPEHFIFSADELLVLLAGLGAVPVFRKKRILCYWFIFGMIFLFSWGTKWEQYACIVTVPICIAACDGMINASEWFLKEKTGKNRAKIDLSQQE